MNQAHLELCSSAEWASHIETEVLPWVLDAVDLDSTAVLEIGPGPGAATAILRQRCRSLTAVESDPELAAGLAGRFAGDPAVEIRHGDGTCLPFGDGRFSAAACFTMLHHLPTAASQDRLFSEAARVLTPEGVFFGTDSLDGPGFRRLHQGDTCTPVDPLTLGARLHRAGFVTVDVAVLAIGVRFIARKTQPAKPAEPGNRPAVRLLPERIFL